MAIGERIKYLRNKLGLSQVDFADKIGVSKQTLYKYENNIITNIPSDKVEAIANLCKVSPSHLMGWDEDDIDTQSSNIEEIPYYLNDDAREMAQFMFENPEYKVLFDASRKVSKDDIDVVKAIMDKFKGDN